MRVIQLPDFLRLFCMQHHYVLFSHRHPSDCVWTTDSIRVISNENLNLLAEIVDDTRQNPGPDCQSLYAKHEETVVFQEQKKDITFVTGLLTMAMPTGRRIKEYHF